ncbi:aspartate/glutamate racemase family protein [uncultured Thioclava sp.]|uniref:aspartate/glutamate racemase family protein n=1 Tax=uncultured Thioclava sp. TaxID=473858 RepID=UPI0025F99354|nr:aspartate/glutamate racemase family protein [uncultured Thioclava sp.]
MPERRHESPNQLAMIHTVAGLIPDLETLTRRHLPEWQVFNMLDESLLRLTIRDGAVSAMTARRLTGIIWSAVDAGADAVLVTCSSLGNAVEMIAPLCPVPLLRIDAGMAQAAVANGGRIGVLATLQTTLTPTADLIAAVARETGASCTVTSQLVEGAFETLQSGDREKHDAQVAEGIARLARESDVVVLAQASMARALDRLEPRPNGPPVLTSPALGIAHIAKILPR